MSVLKKNIDIGRVFIGTLPISAILVGRGLIWEIEGSTPTPEPPKRTACFSGGFWDDNLPWIDNEVWVDNII